MKVKIIGAGSIGNHLAQACRRKNWDVTVTDTSSAALERMRDEIYPKRYGKWDPKIQLYRAEPKGGYDIIMIGTPPDSHIKLAIEAIKEGPRLLHIEKPLSFPTDDGMAQLSMFENVMCMRPDINVMVGYNHAVSDAAEKITNWVTKENKIGKVFHIGVEWREHWGGIFAAHPWLKGPEDSYLGYWRRGGGAGCEHSHALHLWIYFSSLFGWSSGEIDSVLIPNNKVSGQYDKLSLFLFRENSGKNGFVIQDVVTEPTKKVVKFLGTNGSIEWRVNGSPKGDVLILETYGAPKEEIVLEKTRPDDFYKQICHYDDILSGKIDTANSPLRYQVSKRVMEFLHTAFSPLENKLK